MEASTPPQVPDFSVPSSPTRDEKLWAMVAHLLGLVGHTVPFGNVIGPLVIWLVKRKEMPFVNDQGKEAVNFQITFSIYFLIGTALWTVVIGMIIVPIVYIVWLVLMIMAAIKSNDGVVYRYPATIRFIK
jgi:uncharacterized Tic20 family protein